MMTIVVKISWEMLDVFQSLFFIILKNQTLYIIVGIVNLIIRSEQVFIVLHGAGQGHIDR